MYTDTLAVLDNILQKVVRVGSFQQYPTMTNRVPQKLTIVNRNIHTITSSMTKIFGFVRVTNCKLMFENFHFGRFIFKSQTSNLQSHSYFAR